MDEPRDDKGAELSALTVDQAGRIIARLGEVVGDRRVVLVGGQAVAIWASQLQDRIEGLPVELVASRDIDLLGDASDLRRAAELLGGRARLTRWEDRTTLAGVAIFFDGEGRERRLDVLESAYGMSSQDLRETAVEVDLIFGEDRVRIWVMHPERCMESRVHNSALPSKQTELAWRQLRASILCARAFSELLLDERGPAGVRDVLNLNERIFRFARGDRCGRLARDLGIEVFDAVLDDERLPENFRAIRLPQMREGIRRLR